MLLTKLKGIAFVIGSSVARYPARGARAISGTATASQADAERMTAMERKLDRSGSSTCAWTEWRERPVARPWQLGFAREEELAISLYRSLPRLSLHSTPSGTFFGRARRLCLWGGQVSTHGHGHRGTSRHRRRTRSKNAEPASATQRSRG